MAGDAFAHHVWATVGLADACLALNQDELATAVPGTYGSSSGQCATSSALPPGTCSFASGDRTHLIDADQMDVQDLRAAMEAHQAGWSRLLEKDLDPETILREVDDHDGFETPPCRYPARAGATPRKRSSEPGLHCPLRPSACRSRTSMSGPSACTMAASSSSHRRPEQLSNPISERFRAPRCAATR